MAGKESAEWKRDWAKLLKLVETRFGDDIAALTLELGRSRTAIYQKIANTPNGRALYLAACARYRQANPEEVKPAPAAAPIDPTDARVLTLERKNLDLASQLRAAEAKLRVAYADTSLFERAAVVIQDHQPALEPLKVTAAPKRKEVEQITDCDAVLLLSDEHADQVVTSAGSWGMERYDFGIFRCRLARLHRQIVGYVTRHLPAHRFQRLWVFKLGDAVNGDIHGAAARSSFGSTLVAALHTGDAEAQFLQALTPYFPGGVHVVAISGNHPRRSSKKDYDTGPHDNFDFLVAKQIETRLADEVAAGTVTVHTPQAWTAFVDIRGYLWALNHGDDVVGFAGFPWYGFDRKNNRIQAMVARNDARVSYFAYGHFHTALEVSSGGGRSMHNGAFPMTSPYALEKITAGNDPTQMLYVHSDRGVVLPIPLYTRDPAKENAFLAGEYDPPFGQGARLPNARPLDEGGDGFNVIRLP